MDKGKVHIIDNAFYMPQLHRWRRVWIYLPAGYAAGEERYPVLYMHDGQNLFEPWSAFGEEWQVDETLDRIGGKCIVAGIDNGGDKRIAEYNCLDHPTHGKAEGHAYLSFLTQTLKPYIDKTYRTRPEREHTWIAGSSMGGLISFFAAVHYPQFYGAVGIFSPSFWLMPDFDSYLLKKISSDLPAQKIFFYGGEQEGAAMIELIHKAVERFKATGQHQVQLVTDPDGDHSEAAWRLHFPAFFSFVSGSKKTRQRMLI